MLQTRGWCVSLTYRMSVKRDFEWWYQQSLIYTSWNTVVDSSSTLEIYNFDNIIY